MCRSRTAHKLATFGLSVNRVSNARGHEGVYKRPACLPAAGTLSLCCHACKCQALLKRWLAVQEAHRFLSFFECTPGLCS